MGSNYFYECSNYWKHRLKNVYYCPYLRLFFISIWYSIWFKFLTHRSKMLPAHVGGIFRIRFFAIMYWKFWLNAKTRLFYTPLLTLFQPSGRRCQRLATRMQKVGFCATNLLQGNGIWAVWVGDTMSKVGSVKTNLWQKGRQPFAAWESLGPTSQCSSCLFRKERCRGSRGWTFDTWTVGRRTAGTVPEQMQQLMERWDGPPHTTRCGGWQDTEPPPRNTRLGGWRKPSRLR